jgi:hypothetical protein
VNDTCTTGTVAITASTDEPERDCEREMTRW